MCVCVCFQFVFSLCSSFYNYVGFIFICVFSVHLYKAAIFSINSIYCSYLLPSAGRVLSKNDSFELIRVQLDVILYLTYFLYFNVISAPFVSVYTYSLPTYPPVP